MPNVLLTKIFGGLALISVLVAIILFYRGEVTSLEKEKAQEDVKVLVKATTDNQEATKKASQIRLSNEQLSKTSDVKLKKLVTQEKLSNEKSDFSLTTVIPDTIVDIFNAGLHNDSLQKSSN